MGKLITKPKVTAGVLALLLVMAFTLQNAEVVSIRFLLWEFSISRAILLFLVFAAGIVFGWVLSSVARAPKP